MGYGIAADAVMLVHFAFILFATFGSLATLRWPRLAWSHVPCLIWAISIALTGSLCPLTPLEDSLRRLAGERGLSGGFIEHYIQPLIYPEGLTRPFQVAMGVILISINAVGYGLLWRRQRRKSLIRGPIT
jgi:hypothetical protein